jgi:hypothetical protein
MTWRSDALCLGADVDLFFDLDRMREAKTMCSACAVTAECLEDALSDPNDIAGVRGGTSATERKLLRRQRGGRTRFCEWCRSEFTQRYSNHTYCSKDCALEGQRAYRRWRAEKYRVEA